MRLPLVGLLALSFLKSCDLGGGPEVVRQKFETALHPYFPNAFTQVMPERQMIIGYTCLHGAGPALIEQVGDFLLYNKDIQQLKTLRSYGPILGSRSYQYVGLVFDERIARLNVDTWQVDYVDFPSEFEGQYREYCRARESHSTSVAQAGYLWIGHFVVSIDKPINGQTEIALTDSLGLYSSSEEFEAHKAVELRSRESLIRVQLAEQNIRVIAIRLASVSQLPVPANP